MNLIKISNILFKNYFGKFDRVVKCRRNEINDKFIDESSEFGKTEEEDRLNLIKISNTLFKNYFGKLEEIKSMINSSTSRVSLEEQKRRTD